MHTLEFTHDDVVKAHAELQRLACCIGTHHSWQDWLRREPQLSHVLHGTLADVKHRLTLHQDATDPAIFSHDYAMVQQAIMTLAKIWVGLNDESSTYMV